MAEDFQAHVPSAEDLECDIIGGRLELQCQICQYILSNPKLLSCCGNHLCEKCVEAIKHSRISGVRSCPFCKAEGFTTLLNKGLLREINLLRARCPNSQAGCPWEGALNNVAEHVALGRGSQGECQYQVMKCQNTNCGSDVRRKDLYHHESELCKFRPYKCKFCLDFCGTYEKVSTEHFPLCTKFPMDCPNHCGCDPMPRASIQDHLAECPVQKVSCDFESAGCKLIRARNEMPRHNQTCHLYHSSLLAKQNAFLKAKLLEVDQKLEGVVRRQIERDECFNSLLCQQESSFQALLHQQETKFQTLLNQHEAKHKKQLSSLQARLTEVEGKVKNATTEVIQFSEDMKKAIAAKEQLTTKIATMENKLASETNQLAGDLNSIKMDMVLLKQNQEQHIQLISTITADTDKIEPVSSELAQLSLSLAELKAVDVEASVAHQLSPTLSTLDDLRESIRDNKDMMSCVHQDLKYVERCMTPQPPFPFTVSRFKERKFNKEVFVSPAFYTHPRGYKMCVRVDLYGMNNHVAVHCCVMRGEHDEMLAWPFRGDIHICIENQLGPHNKYEKVIIFDETTGANKSGRVVIGDKNYLHGLNQFISHQELGLDTNKNCQYLKGDALDFVVVKVDVK